MPETFLPLEPHHYVLTAVGDAYGTNIYNHKKMVVRNDINHTCYRLSDVLQRALDAIPERNNGGCHYCVDRIGPDVGLVVRNADFAREILHKVFGWPLTLTVPRSLREDAGEWLTRAKGRVVRTNLYGNSVWLDAYTLEKSEDAPLLTVHCLQLSYDDFDAPYVSLHPRISAARERSLRRTDETSYDARNRQSPRKKV